MVKSKIQFLKTSLIGMFFFSGTLSAVHAQQQELRGLLWEDDRYHAMPIKLNVDLPPSPPSVSLKSYCPRVVNQGGTNTAVSWATVWYARTMLESVACERKDIHVSTYEAFNNFFNNRLLVKDCAQPVSMMDMLNSLETDGAKRFKDFKTFCLDTIYKETMEEAKENRISGYVRLFNEFDPKEIKVNAIRSALQSKNPVVIGLIPPATFGDIQEFWQVRGNPLAGKAGHAVCLVGYDDAKFGGAFEIVNSWGKNWGTGGFTWVRYEEVKDYFRYGFELFDSQYGACIKKTASAKVNFIKTDGTEMPALGSKSGVYRIQKTYPTKTEFKVDISTQQKMFVYAIYADPNGEVASIFPYPGQSFSNAIPLPQHQLKLPVGNFPFTLEPPVGANFFAFIFSSEPLDVQASLSQLSSARGNFETRIKTIFHYQSLGQNIKWKEGMNFEVDYDQEMFVLMVVQLDQT